jgi:homoserine/homoserine lactone efflux protein
MTFEIWAVFVVTETILCLTPGPAVLLVLSQGLARGAAASVWANLGILSGNAVYFALSATGLGAVLVASYELFSLIRWMGAAYLVWLGVMAFVGRSEALSVAPDSGTAVGRGRMFVNGFVLQVANPKALVFFVALLPQFVDARGAVVSQVLVLGITSVVIEFFVLLGYGAAGGRASALAGRPRFRTLANRLAGSMLIVAGVGIARQRPGGPGALLEGGVCDSW